MKKTKQPSKIRTFSGQLTQRHREQRGLSEAELGSVTGGVVPEHMATLTFSFEDRPWDCD